MGVNEQQEKTIERGKTTPYGHQRKCDLSSILP
jgi:hypothetical protein